ncbi:helix-turn-helix domain-containing protein [Streptomyces mirabilis]|uniref:helix-turn-helix domain-containing protein n=1 Tax=Streptomyces mirabilis TaxID=68239 RepID=UPI0037F9964C
MEDEDDAGWPAVGPAAVLLCYDREHHSDFAATLLAYLETFGDIARAAAMLHVHVNTMRYRVRRLCELSGLNLEDPDERLNAHLQLRLHAFTRPEGAMRTSQAGLPQ